MQSLSGISEYGSNDFQYPHKRNHQLSRGVGGKKSSYKVLSLGFTINAV